MKKYLLLFGLVALAACGGSRDEKSCNCYEQKFERKQRINPKGETVSDTGWQSVGAEKEYSNNCSDNDKIVPGGGSSTSVDIDGSKTITTSQFRYKCYDSKK